MLYGRHLTDTLSFEFESVMYRIDVFLNIPEGAMEPTGKMVELEVQNVLTGETYLFNPDIKQKNYMAKKLETACLGYLFQEKMKDLREGAFAELKGIFSKAQAEMDKDEDCLKCSVKDDCKKLRKDLSDSMTLDKVPSEFN